MSDDGTQMILSSTDNEHGCLYFTLYKYYYGNWYKTCTYYDVHSINLTGSMCLSKDGNRFAYGISNPDDRSEFSRNGYVKVIDISKECFSLLTVLEGKYSNEEFGKKIAFNQDGSSIVVTTTSTPYSDSTYAIARIFIENNNWNQDGGDIIIGDTNHCDGLDLCMDNDGMYFCASMPNYDSSSPDNPRGRVCVFSRGNTWTSYGTVDGQVPGECYGKSVKIGEDGKSFIAGGPYADSGYVRIYKYNDTNGEWQQYNSTLQGDNNGDEFGYCVSMSGYANQVIIGAPNYDNSRGLVKIFNSDNGNWKQYGADFIGKNQGDCLGTSVQMSTDGTQFSIAAPSSSTTGYAYGYSIVPC